MRLHNVSHGKDAQGKWRKPTATCAHCLNDGIVLLDGTVEAAPCPMCIQGAMNEVRDHGADAAFWSAVRLSSLTWNNGCSIKHIRKCRFQENAEDYWGCGKPAHGNWCNFHDLESNRVSTKTPMEWAAEAKALASRIKPSGKPDPAHVARQKRREAWQEIQEAKETA